MIAVPLLGIAVSYLFYGSKTLSAKNLLANPTAAAIHKFWFSGWGLDWLYQKIFVTPFLTLARINKKDIVDSLVALTMVVTTLANSLLSKTQNGQLRWYAASIVAGLVVIIAIGVML